MSKSKLKQLLFLQILFGLFVSAVSCNSKDSDDESEIAVTPALVAVKRFYLTANDSVLQHLDSVAFSIDLNTGLIFNADSLPKGTNITRLIPAITFANTMTKAELTFLKDNEKVTVNYLTNPTDSIDFTYPVSLDVTAEDGINSFSYQIKVNVHKVEPDTLVWDKLATSPLPSKLNDPVAQKTVIRNDVVFSLIEEYNEEITLSYSTDLNKGEWSKTTLDLNFSPKIESFTATDDSFWMLDATGNLYSSQDGLIWNSEGVIWTSILGSYGESILGIRLSGEDYVHTQYPLSNETTETILEEDFPLYAYSGLGVVETEWYPKPFAILTGGITAEGNLSSKVWAFDGSKWAIINDSSLPALEFPMMCRYVVYRDTPYVFTQRELDVWLLFGGVNSEGEMNRTVFMSYDNGVNWIVAPENMQLPESIPSLENADIIVAGYELSADVSQMWTPEKSTKTNPWTRASYTIDGYEVKWVCPYLYIFGGYSENETLSTDIWRGVIARLEFMPLI